MAKRMVREEAWGSHEFVLTDGEVAEQGHMACLDTATGEVTPGAASTTLIPIGWFDGISDKLGVTGDGTVKVNVRLFSEVEAAWWDNADAPNDVGAGDVGNEVYI